MVIFYWTEQGSTNLKIDFEIMVAVRSEQISVVWRLRSKLVGW